MHVTVCIGTRNRGESVVRTLRSVVSSHYKDFDVIVVDQSEADDTYWAVRRATADDSRFMYIRSHFMGASASRNTAVQHAQGPLIAFTDDDCEVSPEWLGRIVSYFRDHDHAGQICGPVQCGPHDPSLGFIPAYPVPCLKQISSPWLKWREGGIGANMAFRLDVLRAVGPFDPALGPGTPLFSCEDGDMTYRVLKAGFAVLNVPDAYVVHHGFRTWGEGQRLMRGVGIGVAAAYMKHLRLRDTAILPTFLLEWMRCISWRRLLLLRRRSGVSRFLAYIQGVVLSFRYSIDRHAFVYIPNEAARIDGLPVSSDDPAVCTIKEGSRL